MSVGCLFVCNVAVVVLVVVVVIVVIVVVVAVVVPVVVVVVVGHSASCYSVFYERPVVVLTPPS